MNRLSKRLRRSRRCEHVFEAWGPHEGCAEFMSEPDLIQCGDLATREVVEYVHPYATRNGRGAVVRSRLCTDCATNTSREAAADPTTVAVLVRPLAGAK